MTAAGVASAQTKKLLKFSLSLFRRGFNSSKCKTAAKMAVARIKLLRNKRQVVVKQMRRDIAVLLQSGQDATARIRVEHVIREQNIQAANEIIELFCELIVSRLTIITKQKECPVDLKEGIASLIFAAPRCSEIPELGDLRDIFVKKYGKDFVSAATDLRPTCGVNLMLVDKLSVRHPGGEFKLKFLKEIAKEFQVDWDTTETEQELLKPEVETIGGPTTFVSASSLPVNRAAHEYIDPTQAVPRSSSSTSINTHYHDSESAAEAAGELAKQAVAAAQVAALLATRRDSTTSLSLNHSANQKDHYHPGSRKQSRDSETSSYYAKPASENRGIGRRHSYNNPSIHESDHEEEDDYTKTEAKETTIRRRHSYNSPSLPPPPLATSEINFDESDYYGDDTETEPEERPSQTRASSLPPNRAPPQAPQASESRRDSSGHQAHPKLPDYDLLAARFKAIRDSKGPLI
ncbi:hypothetical protein AALP_AA7G232900 [Arabis alpina]|uniref:IST1-like protein n=1 Tax=Arabis alpina TaxID=50452 RepID=A0A087GK14_ARAAL|nr:hypothetical protein AALP_AA7G232900 [Arabis alpina]